KRQRAAGLVAVAEQLGDLDPAGEPLRGPLVPVDRDAPPGGERGGAAGVIAMVMREQDPCERTACLGVASERVIEDRLLVLVGRAGIDHDLWPRGGSDQIDVGVCRGRERGGAK